MSSKRLRNGVRQKAPAYDVLSSSPERPDRRIQRLLLRHVSGGGSGNHRVRVLAPIITAVFLSSPLIEVQARSLYVPFFKSPVVTNMGWFTILFFALVIVGSSNAVNLTDGLDGLAIGCTVTVAFAYAFLSYAAGNFRIA